MRMNDPKLLYFDIEVTDMLVRTWWTGKQYIRASQIVRMPKIICIAYKQVGTKTKAKVLKWSKDQDDTEMLKKFVEVAAQYDGLVGHNSDKFDIRWIVGRLFLLGLKPMKVTLTEDTIKMAKKQLRLPGYALNDIAKWLGVGEKIKTDFQLWVDVTDKNDRKALKVMCGYCAHDVEIGDGVYVHIAKYCPVKFNKAVANEDPRISPCCGASFAYKGYVLTKTGKYHQIQCHQCHGWRKFGHNLITNSSSYAR